MVAKTAAKLPLQAMAPAQLRLSKRASSRIPPTSIPQERIAKSLLPDFVAEDAMTLSPLPSSPGAAATALEESRSELQVPVPLIEAEDGPEVVAVDSPPLSVITTSSSAAAPAPVAIAEAPEDKVPSVQLSAMSDGGIAASLLREALSRVWLSADMDPKTKLLLGAVLETAIDVMEAQQVPDSVRNSDGLMLAKSRVGLLCVLTWLLALFFIWVFCGGESFSDSPPPT